MKDFNITRRHIDFIPGQVPDISPVNRGEAAVADNGYRSVVLWMRGDNSQAKPKNIQLSTDDARRLAAALTEMADKVDAASGGWHTSGDYSARA
ncbi:MAG TPA: hypothetical protein VE733_20045 [Streptosporangiaceae bacterium]|jgi:hypothetical protein|nr:hypothetical protein [Streptosporangiaceae bacterium]